MTYQNPVVYFNRNEISHTYFGISNGDLFNRMPGDTRKRLITFVDMQKCQESDHLQFLIKLYQLLDAACGASQEFFYYPDEAVLRWVIGPLASEHDWAWCDDEIGNVIDPIEELCVVNQATWIMYEEADSLIHRLARARFKRFNSTRLLDLGRSRTARFRV